MTRSVEDYLKIVYEISKEEKVASTSKISKALRVAPASVTEMLKKLAEKVKLRKYQKHPRGPKKPQPKRVFMKNKPHVSTARILAKRKK